MSRKDFFSSFSLGFDELGTPHWGDTLCDTCKGKGWHQNQDIAEDNCSLIEFMEVLPCICALPDNQLDADRMEERIQFVLQILQLQEYISDLRKELDLPEVFV